MKEKKIKTYIVRPGYADVGSSPGTYAYKIKASVVSNEEAERYKREQYSKNSEEEFNKLIKGKRVAIVGPAKILEGKGLGEAIDSYDTVIRMNGFFGLSEALVGDFGKKCDILYINGSTGKNAAYKNQELLMYPKKLIGIRKTSHVLCYSIFPLEEWEGRGLKMICKAGVDDSILENNTGVISRRFKHFAAGTVFQKPDEDTIYKFKQLPLIGPTIIAEVVQHNPEEVYVTGFDFYINGISWAEGYAGAVKRTGGHTYEENAIFMKKMIDEGKIKVDDDLVEIIERIITKKFVYDETELFKQGKRMMKASVKK